MPKRVIHGEGVWRSDKLKRVEPEWVRAEYANLIPLALANGVFEANPARIWADVYSYNRPDVKPSDVEQILNSLEAGKLLFRWTATDGKVWGYWVGIEKPGRLPGKSRRGRNEVIGPNPPEAELRKFMDSNVILDLPSFGFGLGSGMGFGEKEDAPGIGAPGAHPPAPASPSAFSGLHLQVKRRQDQVIADGFPWVDRQAEYRKADSWLEANPERRPRKQSKFIHNWFARISKPSDSKGGTNGNESRKPGGAVAPTPNKYDDRRPDGIFH